MSGVTYPALGHIRKGETSDYRTTIEEVLTNLSIHVTPEDKFRVTLQSIFKTFTKICTNSY